MKKILIYSFIIIIILVGTFYFSKKTHVPSDISKKTQNQVEQTQNSITSTSTDIKTSQTYNISIKDFSFNQKNLTIKNGDTVVWTNNDSAPHTVTGDTFVDLNSPNMSKGDTYSFTFNSVGTYNYHCAVHPMMKATIIVK